MPAICMHGGGGIVWSTYKGKVVIADQSDLKLHNGLNSGNGRNNKKWLKQHAEIMETATT